ncbi:hypothetical protein [Streptococcus oralis]|nr:hypothetical protein [Streptococcus oralis]
MTFPDFFDRMKLKKTLSKGGATDGTFVYILNHTSLFLLFQLD